MKTTILFILISLFVLSNAYSTIRGVPGTYSTIQLGINAAANGDTVLVEPGTYFENVNFRGKKIVVTSRFYLSNDLSYITSTVINGSTPVNPDSASVVIIGSGCDSTTVLQGFKITGGTGTKWTDEHGAGVFREGGGVLTALSSPVIRFNIIANNSVMNTTGVTGTGGGGIRAGDGMPRILNNMVMYNTGKYGAGIVLNYTGATVKNNIIYGNSLSSTYNAGTAIWADNVLGTSKNLIENNTVVGNSSVNGTPGILSAFSANIIVRNNIVWGNTGPGNIQMMVSGATLTATYNDVQFGYTGAGNINIYPQFTDSNFVLLNSSPCIDAGDSSAVYNDPIDPLNPPNPKFPSKGTIRNDMGAYGGPLSAVIAVVKIIGIKNINTEMPDGYILFQNYPNPFNPNTNIRFQIKEPGIVSLKIFNVEGREIESLLQSNLKQGTYEVSFDGKSYASGTYFYKLKAGDYSQTKTMMLIK
ncbi:MAG: T9SS type A sorting domain-containing protein [Ignavibacteriae bacterium]|nr:T9SS type A sorting domain-containing protein [Ignavibacteriota bacterium]